MRKKWIISVVLGLWAAGLAAQSPFFKSHPLENVLEDIRVHNIYESPRGFIWMGSDKGLLRYNGKSFQRFPPADTSHNPQVTAIFEDQKGLLWVGYEDGAVERMAALGTKLSPWAPEEGLPKVAITGFAEDAGGAIWLATYGEGLYCYVNQRLYNINADDGLPGNDIYCLVRDKKDRIWVGTDGGFSRCALKNGKKTVINITREQGLPDDIVRTIQPDENDNLWIGTYDRGVCYFNTSTQKFGFPMAGWDKGVVNKLAYFEGLELWIGTEGNGLYRFDLHSRRLQAIRCSGRTATAKIYDLHKDAEGNIWVVNNVDGICSANRQFGYIDKKLDNIQAVLVDHNQLLWIGTQKGLYSYQALSSENIGYKDQLADLQLNVLSLFEDQFNNIWIGTFGQGIYCFNPLSGRIRRLSEADGLTNGSVLSITGVEGHIWMATLGGVTAFDGNENIMTVNNPRFRNYNRESGLGSNFIYKAFIDSKGRTWFGTDGKGISVLSNGKITNYTKAGNTPVNSVYSITEDHRGHIWFSTAREGIFEFDGSSFNHLTIKEGLRNQAITSLATDAKGNILIVHASGVDLLNPVTKHLIYYDEEVGLKGIDPNLNAVGSDSQGNIWIGTQNQVFCYTALRESLSIDPRTYLNAVSVFLEPIDFSKPGVFKYNQNSLVFEFVGLWYTDPETVKYRYKIDGVNFDWIVTTDLRAVYSNLSPGKYTFRVSSTENDAFDQEPEVTYSFTIKTPVWRQVWFILLCIVLASGLIYGFIRQRERRLLREDMLKREKIESQFEALKSQINPHFLFNSFNTLITIIEENPELAVEYVENLSDFYRSILQYREKELIPLREEMELVKSYAFLMKKRYGDNFQLHTQVNGETAYVAPLTLQMLVENAVKHNVISKIKPLRIDIDLEGAEYITVRNNIQKKMTPKQHSTGFGLQSIVTRYSLLTDKKVRVEENEAEFRVSIPLIKNEQP